MSSSSFWDVLGNLASLVQLTGVDAFLVVSMIAQAARTAQHNRDLCQQLSREVVIVGGLLEKLQIPELRRYRETRQALDELGKALFRGYVLVWCCSQQQSTLLQIFKANDMASMLGRAKEDIHFYISLIPTIKFVAYVRRIQDDETNDLGPAQRLQMPRLSIQEVTDSPPTSIQAVTNSLALEEQRPQPYPNFTQNLELTQSQFSRASASNWAQGLTNVERLLELVVMIGHSADTASYNSVQCQQLAYRALIIGSMVETRWRLRRPLEQLEDVLRRGYILVSLCSHYSRSQLRLIFTRADVASVFRLAQEEMIRQIYFLTDPSPVEEARDVTNNHARIPSDVLSPPVHVSRCLCLEKWRCTGNGTLFFYPFFLTEVQNSE